MLELRALTAACDNRLENSICVGCGARAFSVCASLPGDDLVRLDAIAERIVLAAVSYTHLTLPTIYSV